MIRRVVLGVALVANLALSSPAVRTAMTNKGIVRISGVVQATAGWNDYRSVSLGAAELPAGLVSVVLRPRGALIAGTLMDIRGIEMSRDVLRVKDKE